ncbi:putative membrane protein YeaQ/YmgE (transglycosylase-associated protein family) [Deinobacterium chartae]|uniref:Putative membrane protein YeaQ/YmgE (Transglycosylase-associated protein family) n=1 Tax=Deinobacterium chartae TaxID=521158 RepID=A0A841HZQ5_9DEIO|nr:GlsB/YeaQ/YmgE family stress response membrane protein [Deinobacterium chartae]MBB6099001.1 putative membrane protein YeaQ/YmgE (transglycosylase-associated protein family) [Deinobacterium chartae]
MDWIITILVGALIGWLASIVMRTNAQQGAIANILIGIFGSLLGRWIFGDVLNIGSSETAGTLSLVGILWGVLGAIILIAILKALRVLR